MKKLFLILILLIATSINANAYLEKANFSYGTIAASNLLSDAESTGDTFAVTMGTYAEDIPNGDALVVIYSSTCSSASTCPAREIVRISASSCSGTSPTRLCTLTVDTDGRNEESTTHSGDWGTGSKVYVNPTAGTFTELETAIDAFTNQYAWEGEWSGATTYDQYDVVMVTDTNDYHYYISKNDSNLNHTPTEQSDDTYWWWAGSRIAGTDGAAGADGVNCWDLNSNGSCDTGTEDIDLDADCDVDDCNASAAANVEIVDHTTSATITCENGQIHTNNGAAGTITLKINSFTEAQHCRFKRITAQTLQIQPYVATDEIVGITDGAGKGTYTASTYGQLDLVSYANTKMIPVGAEGAWVKYSPVWALTEIVSDNTTGDYTGDYTGTDDTRLREASNTTNYGSATTWLVNKYASGNYNHVALLFSGLSNIPATAIVTSVTIGIYLTADTGSGTHTITLKRLLRNWVEAQATWSIYSTGNNWTTGGGISDGNDRDADVSGTITVSATTGWKTVTVTSGQLFDDVQDFIDGTATNYGWHLERTDGADDSTSKEFISSEGTDGQRPYISVTYNN